MPILKIKLTDAAGQALPGQTVKVSSSGVLQSNAEGVSQFLTESGAPLEIEINGVSSWAGSSDQLGKEEKFQQGAAGFVRVS